MQESKPAGSTAAYDPYLSSLKGAGLPSAASGLRLLRGAAEACLVAGRGDFRRLVTLQFLIASAAGGQVLLTKATLEHLLRHETQGAYVPLLGLVLLSAGTRAANVMSQQYQRLLGERLGKHNWKQLIDVATAAPLEAFDRDSFYDHLQRVEANSFVQPLNVVNGLINILSGLVVALIVILILVLIQPLLLPLLLLAGIPVFWLQQHGGDLEYEFARDQTASMRRRYSLAEVLTGRTAAKEIRAFEIAEEVGRRHDELYDQYIVALEALTTRVTRLTLISTTITAVATAASLAILLLLLKSESVSLASVGAAVAAVSLLANATTDVASGAGRLMKCALYLQDIATLPAWRTAENAQPQGQVMPPFERLRLQGVGYTYAGATEPVLQDINLELHAGEVLALVGTNGSGKTTLSKLLANLYTASQGQILWDGIDVKDLSNGALRRNTAVLFQDFVHYELSLRDNVELGRAHASPEDFSIATRWSGADVIAAGLATGWDTFLSPRFPGGIDISGGEWQRVALGRLLLRDSPFVVLDEPTAALDARAEASFFTLMQQLLVGRTVILVTHRFSSAKAADRIAVMDAGRLVELGSHEELMALDGLYRELFTLQAGAFNA